MLELRFYAAKLLYIICSEDLSIACVVVEAYLRSTRFKTLISGNTQIQTIWFLISRH